MKPEYFTGMSQEDLMELMSSSLILKDIDIQTIRDKVFGQSPSQEVIDDSYNVVFYKELEYIDQVSQDTANYDNEEIRKRKKELRNIYFTKNKNAIRSIREQKPSEK